MLATYNYGAQFPDLAVLRIERYTSARMTDNAMILYGKVYSFNEQTTYDVMEHLKGYTPV